MVQCSYAGLPPQHATSTPAASPKAAGKAGAWFKKTFAAGKTGGWAGVKQSVTRHSAASSVASDDSETLAGGAVTPAPGGCLFLCVLVATSCRQLLTLCSAAQSTTAVQPRRAIHNDKSCACICMCFKDF